MAIRDFLEKFKAKRHKFKEAQEDDHIVETLQERKKSSNERELEKFMEEERQKDIKVQLERFREKQKAENRNMNILQGGNMFKGHKSVLTNDRPILKDNHNMFSMKGMFFK